MKVNIKDELVEKIIEEKIEKIAEIEMEKKLLNIKEQPKTSIISESAINFTNLSRIKEFGFNYNWLQEKYRNKLDQRYYTMQIALNLFLQFQGKTIVETGCQRIKDDWGGGCSTSIFGEFCHKYGNKLYTIDNSREYMEVAKQVTLDFKENITYICDDSIHCLQTYKFPHIDLLYLDSMDCCELENVNNKEAQKHELAELTAIYDKLPTHTIILLDDSLFKNGGKTKLSKEFLISKKCLLLIDYQQTLFLKI